MADESGVHGVRLRRNGKMEDVRARAVVLASGGFEANSEWRTRYLGPGWDLAKVRGSRFNTGDGIRMAMAIGAQPYGNWSGCHAVGWDRNAPEFGDLAVGDGFQKHSYPFGIMVNATGRRFVDEGADFRNYTYAKYGRVILDQPDNFAWQIFDHQVTHLLRDEYRIRQVTKVTADNLETLASRLDALDTRLSDIDGSARAASSHATQAERLMIAFAARRTVERGLPLGPLEGQLRKRFGETHGEAVSTLIAAAGQPVTLEDLRLALDTIAPRLMGSGNEGMWGRGKRLISDLVVLRQADSPSPRPADRLPVQIDGQRSGELAPGPGLAELVRRDRGGREAAGGF